jgi:uncharacterized protein (TIGR02246 family)
MITGTTTAEQGIRQTIEKFIGAWNVHDVKTHTQMFAEDADFTNVFGQSFHGKEAIGAQHVKIFYTMFKTSSITTTEISIRLLTENLAAVDVIWNMIGATDPKGNPWPERTGLMNLIMKFENEEWLILVMHNMDLPAINVA